MSNKIGWISWNCQQKTKWRRILNTLPDVSFLSGQIALAFNAQCLHNRNSSAFAMLRYTNISGNSKTKNFSFTLVQNLVIYGVLRYKRLFSFHGKRFRQTLLKTSLKGCVNSLDKIFKFSYNLRNWIKVYFFIFLFSATTS